MLRATTTLLILLTATTALALDLGPRVGYTSWDRINQMHFGVHAKLGELFPNVEMTPNLEMGFGDASTVITLNGDLAYQFTELTTDPWGFYGGGSLSLNYLDSDLRDGDLDLGFSVLAGFTNKQDNQHEIMGEIRLGVLDSPGFKITFGYTFF